LGDNSDRLAGQAGGWGGRGLRGCCAAGPRRRRPPTAPAGPAADAGGCGKGEADPRAYAHIVDRARAFEGRPTLFATFGLGGLGEWPSEALEVVAQERKRLGLPSLEADLQRFAKGARPGPFLVPYTQWDWFKLAFLMGTARLTLWPPQPRYDPTP